MRVALAVLLLSPASASAQPAYALTLTWAAPPECPDGAAIEANLASIVALPEGHAPPRLEAAGTITATPNGYELVLETVRDGVRGERRLEVAECGELEATASLILALSLGDGVAITAPAPAPAPPPAPQRELEPEPAAPPEPAPPSPVRMALGLELGASWGTLPDLAPRAGLTFDVGQAEWRVRLRLASDLFASTEVTETVRARFSSGEAALGGCWTPRLAPRLHADACVAWTLVRTWARGQGTDDDQEARVLHGAVGGSLGLTVSLSRLIGLRLLADTAIPLVRPRFTISNLGGVHQVEALRVAAVAGLVVRLR